jgi:uncharacterized phage-associated protein
MRAYRHGVIASWCIQSLYPLRKNNEEVSAMTIDALAVANEFIGLAMKRGDKLTPMKIQKLVYYAHGWWLALTGLPLLGEVIQAWSYGPVVRSVYNAFRFCGAATIIEKAQNHVRSPESVWVFEVEEPSIDSLPAEQKDKVRAFLNTIYSVYGGYTAIQLSNMTHEPGSPWDRVRVAHEGKIPAYETIPNDWIKSYFLEQRKKA